jgi:hypothetical protein
MFSRAFAEFLPVLRPNGFGIVYQVLTGPRMSDAEARDYGIGARLRASAQRASV